MELKKRGVIMRKLTRNEDCEQRVELKCLYSGNSCCLLSPTNK